MKETYLKLSNEIMYDIETNVYMYFPKLAEEMKYMADWLLKNSYSPSPRPLAPSRLKFLESQGYNITNLDNNENKRKRPIK